MMTMRSYLALGIVAVGIMLVGCSGGDPPVQTADYKGATGAQTAGTANMPANEGRAGAPRTSNPPGTGRGAPPGGGGGDALKDGANK